MQALRQLPRQTLAMNAIQSQLASPFYVTGGTLSRDALCYVTRHADHQLYDRLRGGNFCYVLTARQMGKSSLMVRTAARLREEGVGVAVLDLTAIGTNLTAEQWYGGLLTQMAQQLNLEDELEEFWDSRPVLGPLQRWMQAVRQVVLTRFPGRVVVFIDEIDAVRSLPFSTDEFFAGIRELYNRRTADPKLERLSFCLLGVAAPSDFIRDTRMTPFNIGQRIELHDFTEAEAQVLAYGLGEREREGPVLLNRIHSWTGGHPYLTQRLCQAVSETNPQSAIRNPQLVDSLCDELFLTSRAREQDDNLLFVRERMLGSEVQLVGLLQLYAQVHRGKRVADDEANPLVTILKLSGITRIENGRLRLRNRIYERVFDQAWVATNMPDAEVKRQRAAYRKGLLRAAAIAAVIIAVISSLAFVAIRQRNLARAAEETNRQQLYAAQMTLAAQAWEDGGVARMMDLLNNQVPKAGQEDLRGFEWYHLWSLAHGDLRSFRHGDSWVQVKFLSNRKIVTVGNDHVARVWDVLTGEQSKSFSRHSKQEWVDVAVSPDDQILALVGGENTVKIWSFLGGQEIATLDGHTDEVYAVEFAPDGRKLATASRDKTVRVWEVATWQEIATLLHSDNPLFAFSPDGTTMATGCHDGIARLWDLTSGRELRRYKEGGSPVLTVAFSPDGQTLVVGKGNALVQFWNVNTGKLLSGPVLTGEDRVRPKTISAHSSVMSASFSPNGDALVVASRGPVKIYSSASLQPLNTFKVPEYVSLAVFSPNGRILATAGDNGVVRLWDVGVAQEPGISAREPAMFCDIAFSPDGRFLATGVRDSSVPRLWDLKTLREFRSFGGHTGETWPVAFSSDGQRLATADSIAKLWDVATGREIQTFRGHTGEIQDVVFSPDDRILATGSNGDQTVKLWDVASGREISTLSGFDGGTGNSVAFSPDGRLLGIARRQNVVLLDVNTQQETITLENPAQVLAIAFSRDGKSLAAGLKDGQVKLWDLPNRQEVLTLAGHVGMIGRLTFFPDGKRLASGGPDGTVKIWNVITGQELVSFRHSGMVIGLAVSSDGRILAYGGEDTIRLRYASDPTTSEESKAERLRTLTADSR